MENIVDSVSGVDVVVSEVIKVATVIRTDFTVLGTFLVMAGVAMAVLAKMEGSFANPSNSVSGSETEKREFLN